MISTAAVGFINFAFDVKNRFFSTSRQEYSNSKNSNKTCNDTYHVSLVVQIFAALSMSA